MLRPTILMYVTYGISVSCLSAALNNGNNTPVEGGGAKDDSGPSQGGLDLGAAYAAWSGIGTIVAALLGVFLYGETLVVTQVVGIVLTIVGVTMVNLVPSSLLTEPATTATTEGGGDGTAFGLSTSLYDGFSDGLNETSANYGSFDGVNYRNI